MSREKSLIALLIMSAFLLTGSFAFAEEPDQLHLAGPVPNQVLVGGTGTIRATVEQGFVGVEGAEVVFTKQSGSFAFTAGVVSPDGTQSVVITNPSGIADMSFTAEGVGPGLIEVTVTGTGLSSFSVFGITDITGIIDADHPYIQYTGRINFDNPLAPMMWWPGSDVIANFEGTSINVKLHDYGDNYFYVIIDDGSPSLINLTPGAATYTVATGLTDSVHKIRLFKRTETTEGEVAFTGFELDVGKSLVAPPARPLRRIEYYGDSITAGHSVAVPIGTGDTNDAWGKDNYYTYDSVTARNFDAEYHCIAISGIGLYIDKWGFGGNMQTLYYDKETGSTIWDFNQWTPQIVVINLGQNDKWGPFTQAGVESNYIAFARKLRGHYPHAHIIIALGDMDCTAPGSAWPGYVQNAVAELNTTYNDPKVYSLIFPQGGGGHPRIARNADMADQLTDFINANIPDFGRGIGDLDDDKKINLSDYSKLYLEWLDSGCDLCEGADLSGDNVVDANDVKIMANNWTVDFSLRGHWKLDGDASDSSWFAHPSTAVDGPVWDPNGRIDGAVELDGINDRIIVSNYRGVLGGQSRTTCAWIKTNHVLGEIVTWGDNVASGGRWVMRVDPSGQLSVQVGSGGVYGSSVLTDGTWHHVAAVLNNDGSPDLNEIKLYVNGTEETVPVTSVPINTLYLKIVKIGVYGPTAKYFKGLIDDVRIYDRPLSEAEIQALAGMGN